MIKLMSSTGLESLKFTLLPYDDDAHHSKSLCFMVEFINRTAAMTIQQLWFYQEDLEKFRQTLQEKGINKTLKLTAMSEFEMTLSNANDLRHIDIKIQMESYSPETLLSSSFTSSAPDMLDFLHHLITSQKCES